MPIPVNKVIIRESAEAEGVVIVDLSKTSATPLTVQKDKIFFSAAGVETLGAAEVGGGEVRNTEIKITANGIYTPDSGYTGFDRVEVELSAKALEINAESKMDQMLTDGSVGEVYKYTGATGRYENGNYYVVE